jgi:hypothetical protein
VRAPLLALLVLLAGCSPSCEELGGKSVQDGTYLYYTMVGKVMVPATGTKYRCELPDKR